MKYNEALQNLQKLTHQKLTDRLMANALGLKSPSTAVYKRTNNVSLTDEEIEKIEHFFKIKLKNRTICEDAVEIKYFESKKLKKTIHNSLVTSAWLDKEIVFDVWKRDPKNLRIIKMPGDRLDGGLYPFRSGDILLVDITKTDTLSPGIYVYTAYEEQYIAVARLAYRVSGKLQLTFNNPCYPTVEYSAEELDSIGFKIIGRVIKNLSFTL